MKGASTPRTGDETTDSETAIEGGEISGAGALVALSAMKAPLAHPSRRNRRGWRLSPDMPDKGAIPGDFEIAPRP
jgi:hypothetical protein